MIPLQHKKKSLKEILISNLTDFNRTSHLLFESFHSLAIPNQQQQQKQQQNQQKIDQPQQNVNPLQFMNLLIESDKNLQNSLKQLEKHQKYQNEIVSVQKEIEEKDKLIATLASNLKSIESFLENAILQDTSEGNANTTSATNGILVTKKEQIEQQKSLGTERNEVTPNELISYAHKISGTTSAPFGYQPNTPLMTLYKPPAPQDDMMRASTLFRKLPVNILKYYGLEESDITTPINTMSPVLQAQQLEQQSQIDQQQQMDVDEQQQLQQQQQQIITPPLNQPMMNQPFASLDLDLNSDLESSDQDDDDDEEDKSSDEEVDWE
ncbi:putative mediator complex subunit 4 [Tieghemostelium lacteum]|uniref:Mediator of RNA polymerase II transcription subunit 4 n=1 Tax=Tieghemostelium lacteum TaxID=361077 RepID=A0A151Z502_TIELA|nr:putative mediator complex subunit 4 [Tieghemostelium lacteum]|eukprot:KYQ89018.1 putative mediator complex subunit 4 [Tieghemostelium lacteum]